MGNILSEPRDEVEAEEIAAQKLAAKSPLMAVEEEDLALQWQEWVVRTREERSSEKDATGAAAVVVDGKNVSCAALASTLSSRRVPHFAQSVYEASIVASFSVFRSWIIDVVRVSPTMTISCIWHLLDNDPNVTTLHLKLRAFFLLVLEFAGVGGEEKEAGGGGGGGGGDAKAEVGGVDEMEMVALQLVGSVMSFLSPPRGEANKHPIVSGEEKEEKSKEEEEEAMTLSSLVRWSEKEAPFIARIIETKMRSLFLPSSPSHFEPFVVPHFEGASGVVTPTTIMPLAMCTSSLQGRWKRLYTTKSDGFNFEQIKDSVLGYEGPTIVIIKCRKPKGASTVVFGAFSADRWKESNTFFGSSKSFLFTLQPTLKLLRAKGTGSSSYQYLNVRAYGHKHGMGWGGSLSSDRRQGEKNDNFRLFIPKSLESCTARTFCPVFEPGNLVPEAMDESFEIDTLEVFATGGEQGVRKGLEAQAKDKEIRRVNLARARTCDKAAFLGSMDTELLLGKTFAHRQEQQDREI